MIFLLMFFGDYVGVVYKDKDVVEWCEEYHPTWTYEQCRNMVGGNLAYLVVYSDF